MVMPTEPWNSASRSSRGSGNSAVAASEKGRIRGTRSRISQRLSSAG